MGEIEIRAAREADVEALLRAYEWLFAPPGARPEQWNEASARRALAAAMAAEDAAVLVAQSGGELAGFATAYVDLHSVRYGPRCWVEDLAVAPAARSRGIGGALLDAVEIWARDRGASHLELDTGRARVDAQRFYERRGEPAVGLTYSWPLR